MQPYSYKFINIIVVLHLMQLIIVLAGLWLETVRSQIRHLASCHANTVYVHQRKEGDYGALF